MVRSPVLLGCLAAALLVVVPSASAKDVTIDWKLDTKYPPQWPKGPHGLFNLPSDSCAPSNFAAQNRLIFSPQPTGKVTLTALQQGTFNIACPVGNGAHCSRGMLQTVYIGNRNFQSGASTPWTQALRSSAGATATATGGSSASANANANASTGRKLK
ncbi:hypothetical protein WJX73_006871 [Symbiochloris irregularis]|uniref:Uncharacterized protein n=1 Tax=Symbiochloris irregularis TaxID=706552 RepID=A0AAW1NQI8_9CHLO